MTINRLLVLLAFVTVGLSTIFLLPKGGAQAAGIRLDLPEFVGNWKGTEGEITEKERVGLGEKSGTEFARKTYRNLDGYEILVSIVLSGHDMSTSIHRPERCLTAQGWAIQESESVSITLLRGSAFPVTKLRNTRTANIDGHPVTRELQTFYWFVSSDQVTSGHWSRWAIDNRDRLFKGTNQRWAFILISGPVPLPRDPKMTEAARRWSEEIIRDFIKTLAPKIHLDSVKYD